MNRLMVNAGTPQAWEIQLKPGVNRIGRGEDNDFVINHGSVSTHHCEITLTENGVLLKDLGSTNGTFVNRAPTQEVWLQPGHHVQFGAVDLLFESDTVPVPAMAEPALASAPPIPIPVPVPTATLRPGGLRINLPGKEATTETVAEAAEGAALVEHEPATAIDAGNAVCKSHPKTPARFLCNRCRKYFCDLCVTTRAGGKFCRSCGQSLTPLRVQAARPVVEKGFYARIPGAFIYPFKGFGLVMLLFATACFGGANYLSMIGFRGLFAWAIWVSVYGLLFLFMQNIIHTTTSDENEPLGFPETGDLFGAAFQLGATVVVCFCLPFALLIARFFEADIPGVAIVAAFVLSCFYFPMAFLAVAMKDSVFAANPLVVIPTIVRIPLEYLVTAILLIGIYGLRMLGDQVAEYFGGDALTTRKMSVLFTGLGVQAAWSFVNIYLLSVNVRILGLLYNSKKQKFGWFAH